MEAPPTPALIRPLGVPGAIVAEVLFFPSQEKSVICYNGVGNESTHDMVGDREDGRDESGKREKGEKLKHMCIKGGWGDEVMEGCTRANGGKGESLHSATTSASRP